MDDLNKQQLVLLALLVSFVTSIATGIATVALLERAPEEVKEPVFQIVERTVERVVEEEVEVPGETQIITEERTVVVREDEIIADAVAEASQHVVRLYRIDRNRRNEVLKRTFEGVGVLVNRAGEVLTTSDSLYGQTSIEYEAVFFDGSVSEATVFNRGDAGVARIKVEKAGVGAEASLGVAPAESVRLGQTALVLGGDASISVASGIVSTVVRNDTGAVASIEASLKAPVAGALLFNSSGALVGLAKANNESSFVPAWLVIPQEKVEGAQALADGLTE